MTSKTWEFNNNTMIEGQPPAGWGDASETPVGQPPPSSPDPYNETVFNAAGVMLFKTDGCTLHRHKIKTDMPCYTLGIYAWRIYIPTFEVGADSLIGAFLSTDNTPIPCTSREIDFEIGYGTASEQRSHGIADDRIMCYMTVHEEIERPLEERTAVYPIEQESWYTFTIRLTKVMGKYRVQWYIQKLR